MTTGESRRLVDVPQSNTLITAFGTNTGGAVIQAPLSTMLSDTAVMVRNVVISDNTTPTSSTDVVAAGTLWFDADYLYVAVANNTIKRVALETF